MGTNFYLEEYDRTAKHIGKSSSMGRYCTDCEMIPTPNSFGRWVCPGCGHPPPHNKHSWTWAIKPEDFLELRRRKFRDEYGYPYLFKEMLEVIHGAREIRFDLIGKEFC